MSVSALASRRVRVRHLVMDPAGQVTVLGQKFMVADVLDGAGSFASGTIERRLYEEGAGTLRLANAAGTDGAANLSRFRCLTDAGFAPGDEWFEVWEDTDLLGAWTPTGSQRVTRGDIQLSGEDATSLLKRTREGQFGYWRHAPRDVIEHYGRAWRAVVAEGFDADGPVFTYGSSSSSDGKWWTFHCESDQTNRPGTVRLRASPGGNAYMATGTPVGQLGGGSSDPHAPWRCDVTFTRSKFGTYGSMSVGLYRNGLTGPTYDLIIPDSTVPQAKAGVGGFQFDALPAPREPGPTTVSVEHHMGWVFFSVDGKVAAIMAMDAGSANYYVGVVLTNSSPSGPDITVDVQSVAFRRADRLLVNDRAGDYRLPGVPAPGGLWGEYYDLTADVARYGDTTTVGYLAFRPDREPAASRVEAGLDYATATPPGWRPPPVPADYWCARYTGAMYLDLDNRDYALRATADDSATVYVARTRIGEHVIDTTTAGVPVASAWLKAGSSAGSAPSGSSGPLAGMGSGWYPVVVEYRQLTGGGGVKLEWENSSAVGTWATVPAASLSPYGIVRDLVRNESHYDALKGVADAYGYQWTCEPRSLESGEFPGRIVPRVRVGRDTEKRLGESEATDLAAELDLDTRADALQADASGISDPAAGAQLTAEMLNYRAAGAHLIVTADYESLADITSPQLLEQRLTTLLALRASPWQTVAARPPGRRELLDAWPLTGTLAEFQWAPGDGIRLDLPTVGVVDTAPRQILGVTRDFTPNGLAPPVAAFRPRPRSIVAALRDLRRAALQPQRNYQQQLAQTAGSVGSQGAYVGGADDYSRLSLPPPDRVVSLFLVVLAKSDASAWTIAMNGASTPIVVTAPGRYDVTAFATANPSGYNIGRLVTGGTGTGDWLVRLEATVRV